MERNCRQILGYDRLMVMLIWFSKEWNSSTSLILFYRAAAECQSEWHGYQKNRRQHRLRKAKREASGAAASSRAKDSYKWEKYMSFLPEVKGNDGNGEGNMPHEDLDVSISSSVTMSVQSSPVHGSPSFSHKSIINLSVNKNNSTSSPLVCCYAVGACRIAPSFDMLSVLLYPYFVCRKHLNESFPLIQKLTIPP